MPLHRASIHDLSGQQPEFVCTNGTLHLPCIHHCTSHLHQRHSEPNGTAAYGRTSPCLPASTQLMHSHNTVHRLTSPFLAVSLSPNAITPLVEHGFDYVCALHGANDLGRPSEPSMAQLCDSTKQPTFDNMNSYCGAKLIAITHTASAAAAAGHVPMRKWRGACDETREIRAPPDSAQLSHAIEESQHATPAQSFASSAPVL